MSRRGGRARRLAALKSQLSFFSGSYADSLSHAEAEIARGIALTRRLYDAKALGRDRVVA